MNVMAATHRALGQNSLRAHGKTVSIRVMDGHPDAPRKTVFTGATDAEAAAFLAGARYACEIAAGWEERWPRRAAAE